jgi:hypothetical protein
MHRRPNRDLLAEDGDGLLSVHDHSAQGAMSPGWWPWPVCCWHQRVGGNERIDGVIESRARERFTSIVTRGACEGPSLALRVTIDDQAVSVWCALPRWPTRPQVGHEHGQ